MSKNKKEINISEVTILGQKAPQSIAIIPEPIRPQISFDMWWATKNLPEKLKGAIQSHMTKRGFTESQRFEEGLKDFGL